MKVVEVSSYLSGWSVVGEIFQPSSSGISLGSEACWMRLATLGSCSTHSSSRYVTMYHTCTDTKGSRT